MSPLYSILYKQKRVLVATTDTRTPAPLSLQTTATCCTFFPTFIASASAFSPQPELNETLSWWQDDECRINNRYKTQQNNRRKGSIIVFRPSKRKKPQGYWTPHKERKEKREINENPPPQWYKSHKRNPEKIDREYALHVNGKRTSLTEGEKEEGVIN